MKTTRPTSSELAASSALPAAVPDLTHKTQTAVIFSFRKHFTLVRIMVDLELITRA